ncbi:MAG TPA: sulfotransferase family 2 domain-containing protein [Methylocella sp.]|nr:sulfotransferase family 2 domain-containing protein [Methylocella sp.]
MCDRHPLTRVKKKALCRLAGVHHYDDVFEALIRREKFPEKLGGLLRRRIPPHFRHKKALFIHVPKNAGTSIAKALYGFSTGHKTAYFYRKADPDFIDGVVAFAVLRDPVERFLSAFSFIQNGGGGEVALESGFAAILKNKTTVDSVLDFIENNASNIYRLDHVLRPQSWYLMDSSGNLIVKKLFVLGFHNKELRNFLSELGVPRLQVLNQTRPEPVALTPFQLDRVRAIYQLDTGLIEQLIAHGPMLSQPFSAWSTDGSSRTIGQPFCGKWLSHEAIEGVPGDRDCENRCQMRGEAFP